MAGISNGPPRTLKLIVQGAGGVIIIVVGIATHSWNAVIGTGLALVALAFVSSVVAHRITMKKELMKKGG